MDTPLDIQREKYLEWKQAQREAIESECLNCDSRVTLGCPFYNEEEETFDYMECFKARGWD